MYMEYNLVTKSGEVINKTKTENMKLAIELFAKLKKLDTSELLEIYQVRKKVDKKLKKK